MSNVNRITLAGCIVSAIVTSCTHFANAESVGPSVRSKPSNSLQDAINRTTKAPTLSLPNSIPDLLNLDANDPPQKPDNQPSPQVVPQQQANEPRIIGKIPIPRRKPGSTPPAVTAVSPNAPFTTGKNGELQILVPQIGRERNPDVASDLRPNERSSWSQKQIDAAKQRCNLVLATTNVDAKPLAPIGGAGGCGIAAPVKLYALGAVEIKPPATLNCTLVASLYKWVTDDVQPAARKIFKQPVVQIRNISDYSCRQRRGVKGGRISEHSFGNALDVKSFKLANGEEIDLLQHWSEGIGTLFGTNKKAKLLTTVHKGACNDFSTVLGPNANKAHANHFHFDLGRGGRYLICK